MIAHPSDRGAAFLVDHLAPNGARHVYPRDLSTPGWSASVGADAPGWCVADGERIRTSAISGVITRLPSIREEDLPYIVAADRAYVATEMNAFLIAWLTALPCPVLNRPSASSLMGPSLSHERWLMTARRAGLKLATSRYAVPGAQRPEHRATVTVVGNRGYGANETSVGQAVALARAIDAELLTVRFAGTPSDPAFASADVYVEPTVEIADAIAERFA